ncbi:MAG: glycosyltransferase family 39 protein [Thermoanaerobaculaceae bacterium]|nr:glycosyltransferase family 39 protein [Thermoanaerobaculaceae bacterium]MDI9622961.1 glycosyltransferase family 39 protein [Acidobacteriota bacterium]NLH11638.1 glycosyltransferase family 39 protein [Holophagae bacterium]HPW56904.1 glycosyltransferase family 39 protein [Thermoanaerobaculaceae bacterium]
MSEQEVVRTTLAERSAESTPLDLRLVGVLAAAKLLVQMAGAWGYGYFRDELYFLDCARHLDFGYVDCAPLVALYAKLALLLGGSLPVVRLIPALAGAMVVAITMLLARQLGGGRFAQAFAGLCVLAAPIRIGVDSILSMNAFEPLFWMGCAWLLVRIVQTGDSRLWLWIGVLAGLGLENKHSTVFFGFALAVAVVASPLRRELGKPWIWLGAGVALLLFLPNVLWQVSHGFPTLEDLENVRRSGKNVVLGPLPFLGQQVMMNHPWLLPVWLTGLVSLLVGKGRRYRVLGTMYVVFLVTMLLMKAKNYYLAPIYPVLFAAGAVALDAWLERWPLTRARLWPRAVMVAVVVVITAIAVFAWLPILPPEKLLAFQQVLGIRSARTEVAHEGPLDQRLGDQFGWPELVTEVSRIYNALPPEERARTGVFASNYGEAGALHLFGPALGLPEAICAHQSHSIWGPPEFKGDSLIWLQWGREDLEPLCREVVQVGQHHHPWGMAEENRPIYLCRGLRTPLAEMWPDLRHWN